MSIREPPVTDADIASEIRDAIKELRTRLGQGSSKKSLETLDALSLEPGQKALAKALEATCLPSHDLGPKLVRQFVMSIALACCTAANIPIPAHEERTKSEHKRAVEKVAKSLLEACDALMAPGVPAISFVNDEMLRLGVRIQREAGEVGGLAIGWAIMDALKYAAREVTAFGDLPRLIPKPNKKPKPGAKRKESVLPGYALRIIHAELLNFTGQEASAATASAAAGLVNEVLDGADIDPSNARRMLGLGKKKATRKA